MFNISKKNNAPVVFQRKICTVCRECKPRKETRSIWLNCALRDDEAVYWVSIGHYEAVIDDTGSVEGIYAFIY